MGSDLTGLVSTGSALTATFDVIRAGEYDFGLIGGEPLALKQATLSLQTR